MNIGENTIQICRSRGLAVTVVERDAGFAKGTIRRWDTHTPSIENVCKVADTIGCSVDEMCGRDDKFTESMVRYVDEMNKLSDDENVIIMAFRTLPDSDKLAIMSQIMKMKWHKEESK